VASKQLWWQRATEEGAEMSRRLGHPGFGLMVTAVVALLLLLPTAVEYAVMLAGITLNGLD
jgi:hypothetical protein